MSEEIKKPRKRHAKQRKKFHADVTLRIGGELNNKLIKLIPKGELSAVARKMLEMAAVFLDQPGNGVNTLLNKTYKLEKTDDELHKKLLESVGKEKVIQNNPFL